MDKYRIMGRFRPRLENMNEKLREFSFELENLIAGYKTEKVGMFGGNYKMLCFLIYLSCYDIYHKMISIMGSSGGSVSGYNADGRGFAPHTGRPCLGSPSLNGYWPLPGNLTAAENGTGHPTP